MMEWLSTIGLVILALAYIITQWRTGGNKATIDTITAYKEQSVLQDKKIAELGSQVSVMEAKLIEKDKQLDLLTKIAENRNPEFAKFMADMTLLMTDMKMFMAGHERELKIMNEKLTKVVV